MKVQNPVESAEVEIISAIKGDRIAKTHSKLHKERMERDQRKLDTGGVLIMRAVDGKLLTG